jgi:hypothetical protein
MSLPWFRLDSHIGSHDKMLLLFSDPSPKRWQAFSSYVCAMGWSVDHGTDGDIIPAALPFVHGTTVTARLLVKYRMWEESANGWSIVNFAERQQLDVITAGKQAARRAASEKANCTRHHAPGCWTGDALSDPLRFGLRIGPPNRSSNVRTRRTNGRRCW